MMTCNRLPIRILTLTATTLVAAATAQAAAPAVPTQKTLKPAVRKYLEEKGNFCLGKFEWPIPVSDEDRKVGTSDAIQMPALEKLGVVSAAAVPGNPAVTQYTLTPTGEKYYLVKRTITVNSAGQKIKHPGDLCPAKLKLDKVVSWDEPTVVEGMTQTTVKYTYKIASAAQWAQDADIRSAFPMIGKILDNAGTQQLAQLFVWKGHGWVAVTPGD